MSKHEVSITGDVVRKRYLRIDRGEPEREWLALVTLDEHAPGLAPRPITRESCPPVMVMSRVTGAPLMEALSSDQSEAMVTAYRRLFAVPIPKEMSQRHWNPAAFVANNVTWLGEEMRRSGLPTHIASALAAARDWHASAPPDIFEIHDPVFAQGDGKIDNMLWDGDQMRLVDFEASGIGDLSFEVADLVEHISARLRGQRDPESVVAGFGLDFELLQRVGAYRIVLATFWLLMLLPGNPGHGQNPEGSARVQADHLLELLGR